MEDLNLRRENPDTQLSAAVLRKPDAKDGPAINRIISACPPLDTNSVYCNLLQCTHFADTCVVAENQAGLVGFTSAYLLPGQAETLFIWQIAVTESARGQGLATRMILELLQRPLCRQVTSLQTTISPGNPASWQLFQQLAETLRATCTDTLMFDQTIHFEGKHPDERLLHIHAGSAPFSQTLKNLSGKLS